MHHRLHNAFLLVILTSLCLACPTVHAETGILVVHVADLQGRPVRGVWIGVTEDGSGNAETDLAGKARIRLGHNTQQESWVSLQIVASPSGTDLGIVQPWNGQKVKVPKFQSDEVIEVVVMNSRDLTAMRNSTISVKRPNVPRKTNK